MYSHNPQLPTEQDLSEPYVCYLDNDGYYRELIETLSDMWKRESVEERKIAQSWQKTQHDRAVREPCACVQARC